MRAARNLQLYSILLLLFSTFTAAYPWPRWLPELDALIMRRDDNPSGGQHSQQVTLQYEMLIRSVGTTSQSSQTIGSSKTNAQETPAPSQSNSKDGDSKSSTTSGEKTVKPTGSSTKATGKSGTSTKKPTTTAFDPRLPAGGVALITPAIIDGPQYFKIGDFVTFAWNYTSLLATPSAVDILATCKENDQTYTLAMNQTIGNATGAVTWDTGAYQSTALSAPLLTETYTLIIYDAASSISAQAQAGYLAVYDQYTFGMYTPQPYTPLNEFQCATCSAAFGDMERRALGMVVGVSVITILSFTWFVGGIGVIW
jgi:hypothetical protein